MRVLGQIFTSLPVILSTLLSAQADELANTGLSSENLDHVIAEAMETFSVPGVSVGIIENGKVTHSKGYGVKQVGSTNQVTDETLFSIASTGKAFTAFALGLLVDEGKLKWTDKVADYLPHFKLYDPWVTLEFTIEDMLIHNSGLGLGTGDLMFWPSQGFTRDEIISNLRHLKPVRSFRSGYAYDNLLYIVAGEVIAAVSGVSYETFIEREILQPLKMKNCLADLIPIPQNLDIAVPHQVQAGLPVRIQRDVQLGTRSVFAAAGGMQCSIASILKWHALFLSNGIMPDGRVLLSGKNLHKMITPHTIMPVSEQHSSWFGRQFSGYGLGWIVADFFGVKVAYHGGGLGGMSSVNAIIPNLGVGIAVYTNAGNNAAAYAIFYHVLEAYLSEERADWVKKLAVDRANQKKIAAPSLDNHKPFTPIIPLENYEGVYSDPWFQGVTIRQHKGRLYFESARSERLKGPLSPFKPHIFIVRWEDRTLNADAYVKFTTDFSGRPNGFSMQAISALTDFSFDFHDLAFSRSKE